MKYYIITKVDNETSFVFSISHHSPTEQLQSIEKELVKKSFKGKVIFDMLLSNGNTKQRFFESFFNGDSFLKNTFVNIYDKSADLRHLSLNFYQQNLDLIEKSQILSKSTKFLIKEGKAI